jgi:hypothetical protein
VYLAVLALLLYVFTKISVSVGQKGRHFTSLQADLYAGALFITKATGFEGFHCAPFLVLIVS